MLTSTRTRSVFEAASAAACFDSLRAAPRIRARRCRQCRLQRRELGFPHPHAWRQTLRDPLGRFARGCGGASGRCCRRRKRRSSSKTEAAHERFGKVMAMLGRRAYVTPSIIAINAAVFLIMLAAGADLMNPNPAIHIQFGSNFGPLTWTGQEWRLLTSGIPALRPASHRAEHVRALPGRWPRRAAVRQHALRTHLSVVGAIRQRRRAAGGIRCATAPALQAPSSVCTARCSLSWPCAASIFRPACSRASATARWCSACIRW